MIKPNNVFYKAFMKALDEMHQYYDNSEKMTKRLYYTAGYHTKLEGGYVHPIKDSLEYAIALLDSGEVQYKKRAINIINKIISLQDQNPKSKTYGIWSYYLEEPLDKMAPPDYNWADFNGKELLYILMEQKDQLSLDLVIKIKTALLHAAYSIKKRNVGPDYTNISLMGAYVTLKAGELLKDDCLKAYGKKRLRKALAYTKYNGSFTEYNSPTYTIVALEVIGNMLKYFEDETGIALAKELNDYGWHIIAHHYHPTTRQLSAPHGRCYDNFVDQQFLSFIHVGTGGKLNLLEEKDIQLGKYKTKGHYVAHFEWARIIIDCPEKYYGYFSRYNNSEFHKQIFYKGNYKIADDEEHVLIRNEQIPELEARTYMTPCYSLGSFTKSDLWNQRRALMAYWGSHKKTSYMRLRCLKDGYDFSSAILFASQNNNHIIGGINFVKDYGDTHIILDPVKDATVELSKLNIRFELGGHIEEVITPKRIELQKPFYIETDSVNIVLDFIYVKFGNYPIRCEVNRDLHHVWLDIILYEGEEISINFKELNEAIVLFQMSIFNKYEEKTSGKKRYRKDGEGNIICNLLEQDKTMEIKLPLKPCGYIENINRSIVS